MRLRFCLILFLVFEAYEITDAAFADTIKRCCDLGSEWADEGLNCGTFPSPVAGIASNEQALCLSSVKMCCIKKHREEQCTVGQKMAKADGECIPKVSKEGSQYHKDCCEVCKMGILIGISGGPCDPNTFDAPWDASFLSCCNELLTTTTIVTDATTIATEATTIAATTSQTTISEKPIAASTLGDVPRATSRNRLSPPPLPELDSLCDTLADELCAHICVPIPGSYRCECKRGFTLMDDGKSCQQRDVSDRCKINNPCEHQCFDTGVAVRCSCEGGYKLNPDKATCRDVDECKEGTHKCDPSQVCVNEEGTYDCIDPEDASSEKDDKYKCPNGYEYNFYANVCDDLDECKLMMDNCSDEGKVCKNIIGSFVCIDNPKNRDKNFECPVGYYYKASIDTCADIDECANGQNDCNLESQICLNIQGGFTCQNKASKTTCPAGFKINMIGLCEDINECKENLEICSESEMCINEQGGYRCVPKDTLDYNRTTLEPLKESTSASTEQTTVSDRFPNPVAPIDSRNNQPYYPQAGQQPQYPYPPNNQEQGNCKPGFTFMSAAQRCIDVDECGQDPHACDSNQECRNTIGSFVCVCKSGFQLDPVTGACIDINECQTGSHDCVHSQRCDNTIGSYQCVRYTNCGTGYTLNAASGLCEDDDECTLGTHDCNLLGSTYQCKNTLGSFRCERKRCLTSTCYEQRTIFTIPATSIFIPRPLIPNPTPNGNNDQQRTPLTTIQLKQCLPGYVKNSQGHCDDINECEATPSPCANHQRCININGSYRCVNVINCTPGYKINDAGTDCEDIDECETGSHKCSSQQQCINREGFHICQCPPGHRANKANQCEDIDECAFYRGQQICGRHADCENTVGSYMCRCKPGFQQTATGKSCIDIDECQQTHDLCEHQCVNVWGDYRCACKPGFTLNADNRTCTDVNECEMFKDKHLCIGICENIPGSYTCRCPEGYRLGSDGRTCQDIDECAHGSICPKPDDVCWNIRGSYRCNSIQCPNNYIRDPVQKNRCKRTTQFCNSRDLNCMRQPSSYSYNFITFVSRLPLPDDGRLDLFTMRGPQWDTTTTFNMEMLNVRCPHSIEKADKSFFQMRRTSVNEVILSLVKVIEGPQDAELQLTMEVYQNGEYKGSVVAKVFVIVSEYQF